VRTPVSRGWFVKRASINPLPEQHILMLLNKLNKRVVFLTIIRIFMGAIFIYAGIFKLINQRGFLASLKQIVFIPTPLVNSLAYLVPIFELIIGFLLITSVCIGYAAVASSILMTLFIFVTIYKEVLGMRSGCGCFPESFILNSTNPFLLVLRNFVFLILSLIIIYLCPVKKPIFLNKLRGSFRKIIISVIIMLCVSIVIVTSKVNTAQKDYVSNIIYQRQLIGNEYRRIVGQFISNINLIRKQNTTNDSDQNMNKYNVILFLGSLDCEPCIDESLFMERLSKEYDREINFSIIIGISSRLAIANYIKKNSITCDVRRDSDSLDLRKKFRISGTALKLIVSPSGQILFVDPSTFNIKNIQDQFKGELINIMNGRR